jgi:hypothetical protein
MTGTFRIQKNENFKLTSKLHLVLRAKDKMSDFLDANFIPHDLNKNSQ